MKKIMILGAAYTQVPLYRAARRMGLQTVAASIPGDYPGFAMADEVSPTNIADPGAVLLAAEKYKIDGIVTCGLDLGMSALGYTAEAMRIPGPSAASAARAGNKWKMKKALKEAGVPTAPFFCVHTKQDLETALDHLSFPVAVKAVDLMGGRGIYRADSREDARVCYERCRKDTAKSYCLIEEYLRGEMFGVEGMIQNGEFVFLLPDNTENFTGGAIPTPVGHSIPFAFEETLGENVREIARSAVRALGLDNCPVNLDMIRVGGDIYVIELTGRSGATGLSEIVGARYGIDYYEILIRQALGEDVRPYFKERQHPPAVLTRTLISGRGGKVRTLRKGSAPIDGLLDHSYNISQGDIIRAYGNGRDRIGQIYVNGSTADECRRKAFLLERCDRVMLEGDLPLGETPIQELNCPAKNRIYMKREDLLPFSFGGNKVRFAQAYLEDMQVRKKDAMILYGGYSSNLCRILTAACRERAIPCSMVYNIEDVDPEKESMNRRLIRMFHVQEYPCTRAGIAQAVQQAVDDFRRQGLNPYYIHGDIYGRGNASVPVDAYVRVYLEICRQEQEMGIHFDRIILAGSTNATQAGLLAGHLILGDERKILGISVNRKREKAVSVILNDLEEYRERYQLTWSMDPVQEIEVDDESLLGGYGRRNLSLDRRILEVYQQEGIPLDPTYTGKAFFGMERYLLRHKIEGEKILFLHTGGLPMFFDYLSEQRGKKDHVGIHSNSML